MWRMIRIPALVIDSIFAMLGGGCHHANKSFPLTVDGRTYQACVDCGETFDYDWQNMRRVSDSEIPALRKREARYRKALVEKKRRTQSEVVTNKVTTISSGTETR